MSDNFESNNPNLNKDNEKNFTGNPPEANPYQAPQNPYQAQSAHYGDPQQYNSPQGQYSYPQYPYQGGYPQQYPVAPEGKKKADLALVLAIVGFFVAPLILGIIGLVFAKQAEELGGNAHVAKIVSWVDIAFGAIGAIFFTLFFIGAVVSGY